MRRRRLLGSLLLACAAGCGAVKETVDGWLDAGEDTDFPIDMEAGAAIEDVADAPAPALDLGTPVVTREFTPLQRSDRKYPFPAKGGANVGFRVDTLAGTYALAGTMEIPTWSAPNQGEAELTRDDDLDTAWTCTPRGDQRCAIGIHFPTEVTLEAVQLFAAAGPSDSAFDNFPRPRRLRIHTAEGALDALMPDDNSHVYAVFGKDVVTSDLTIEVVEVWRGSSSKIHIAEFEVFGSTGEAREPIEIDPARAYVRLEEPAWRHGARDTFDSQTSFVYRIDAEGKPHRFVVGTALRGKAGDRLQLIERLLAVTGCEAPRGTFYLLDTKTRLIAPLGEFGGVGGSVFRASDSNGIAVGYAGDRRTVLDGLFVSESGYHRKRTPLREDKRADDFLAQWVLEREPLRRGAVPLAKAGCAPASEAQLEQLAQVRAAAPADKRGKKRAPEPAAEPEPWFVCDLADGAHAFLTDRGPCGPAWDVMVIDAKGTLVEAATDTRSGSHLGVLDLGGGKLIVQAAGASDSAVLLEVTASGIETFAASASIALEPPGACRSVCDAGYRNPHEPSW